MRFFALSLASALLALPVVATAESVVLFDRTLVFTLPAGMVVANNRSNGTNVLVEYVPKGETLATWTRLVTIQAFRGLGRSSALTAAIARQAFFPATCKIGPIYRDGGERVLSGGTKRTVVSNGCASLPSGAYHRAMKGAGEQDFIYIFRDAERIYTLNYAVRGATFAGKQPPHPPERAEALMRQVFGEVTLSPVR